MRTKQNSTGAALSHFAESTFVAMAQWWYLLTARHLICLCAFGALWDIPIVDALCNHYRFAFPDSR